MMTRIQKWGNSLALRIPKSFAREIGLDQYSSVEMSQVDGKLLMAPAVRKLTLEQLLAEVTEYNMHDDVDAGTTMGREAW